jgi:hypothetical protein
MPAFETHTKHCHKRGYRSRGAAEAHLRGLVKAGDYKEDLKASVPDGRLLLHSKDLQRKALACGSRPIRKGE